MWRERLVVGAVLGGLVFSLLYLVWQENERRYDALAISGCFGARSLAVLGDAQGCTGARRICRDAPPLVDWRRYCR